MITLRYIPLLTLLTCICLAALWVLPAAAQPAAPSAKLSGQNLVFLHPDGAGLSGWNIFRILDYGPDRDSEWDQLPQIAIYRSHMRDALNASSYGGGTTHAY